MTEVGHFEQLLRSRCFQISATLTCTTCHDPHAQIDRQDEFIFYRKKCLTCHAPLDCGEKPASRAATKPPDDCVACHMPQSPIEVPHVAFTHHRIGVHGSDSPGNAAVVSAETLVPLQDVERLLDIDRDRCLGLACFDVWRSGTPAPGALPFQRQAIRLLQDVRKRGLLDPAVESALAILLLKDNPEQAVLHATTALQAERITPTARCDALSALAASLLRLNKPDQAVSHLERLVELRRLADDWLLLALCRDRRGDLPGAVQAASVAADISPTRTDTQKHLASLYRRMGDQQRSHEHERRRKH